MATLSQFEELFAKHDEALENIKEDIQELKNNVIDLGLSAEQEDSILARLQSLVDKTEALALENPEVEEPIDPEEEV